ncbi:MAG: AbrB/MazE/SpoVT family DNA-binding domain-containing protein [Candidatus Nanoperiomorbaceae bacterium]
MLKHNPDLRIYGLAKIGEKGQVVIPALARKELGLRPNNEIIMVGSPSKKILG